MKTVFVIDKATGWPLRGLNRQEREDYLKVVESSGETLKAMRLRIQNPELAWSATRTSVWRRWLESKEAKEDWRVKVAPLALIAVMCLVVVIGVLVWKMGVPGAGH